MEDRFQFQIHTSFRSFSAEEWNGLVAEDSVFQEYEFLSLLEETGCIGARDWFPQILSIRASGVLVAVLPAYIRKDSYGEFIFDFQWANAFHRAGIPYYPKLTASVPFTPVSGNRILISPNLNKTDSDYCIKLLLNQISNLGIESEMSSVHVLFCKEEESFEAKELGFVPRLSHQYHWINRGYSNFEEFLASLVKDRRKTIRQERKKISAQSLKIKTLVGNDIKEKHAEIYYQFYLDTHSKKWGQTYLNRDFFHRIFETFKHRLHLVLAEDGSGNPIGGSMNVYRGKYLFGRYWGAVQDVPFLHFECCYYQLIDFAIENKMERVEAGAQGEHKFLRGYEAVPMHSFHKIFHKEGSRVIYEYLEREIQMEQENIKAYNSASPLKALRGV